MIRKILPSITSTDSDCFQKIKEANRLGLKEVCLFLTGVSDVNQRRKIYELLGKSIIRKIPLVHLRHDTESWEIEYFLDRFHTEVFCAHSPKEYPFIYDWSEFMSMIYYENTIFGFVEEEIKKFAGICIDFIHLDEEYTGLLHDYPRDIEVIKKYPCGCAHVGAMPKNGVSWQEFEKDYRLGHLLKDLSDLDYLKKYSKSFFPAIIALELENNLTEQLKIKEYLERLLVLK